MTSSSGAWVSESKEVRLSRRFAIRASRDTRSPSGLIKTYSAAQIRPRVATSALRSASSYCRMDSRSSASALLVAAELDSCPVAAAGARRISVRNDSKQSRFRITVASLVRIPYWRDQRRQQNIFIPPHPHSGGWCMRKPFTFTTLRNSLMFIVGCSLRAVVMQFLTYLRLAGHLIFLPFASALQATVACLTATF